MRFLGGSMKDYAFLSTLLVVCCLALLFTPNTKAGGCPLQQQQSYYVPQAQAYAPIQQVTSYAQAQIVYPQVQAAQIQFQYVPIQQQRVYVPQVQAVPVQKQVIQKQVQAVPVQQVQKQVIQKQAFVPVQKQSVVYPVGNTGNVPVGSGGGVQQNVIINSNNQQQEQQRRGLFPLFRRR